MIFLIGVFRHAHLMKKICSSETDEFAENWSYEINTYHVQKGIPNALTLKQKYHSYQKPSKFSFGYWSWPNHKLHLLAITFGFHKTLFFVKWTRRQRLLLTSSGGRLMSKQVFESGKKYISHLSLRFCKYICQKVWRTTTPEHHWLQNTVSPLALSHRRAVTTTRTKVFAKMQNPAPYLHSPHRPPLNLPMTHPNFS